MIVLSGATLVLPDRLLSPGTLVLDGDRIVDVRPETLAGHGGALFHGHYIVPGFVDVHVHGVEGTDALDGDDALATIARRLPRYGVTAFCPTTVACDPAVLRDVLDQVRRARREPAPQSARVLPAHLESNFINPEYRGAQPAGCLRIPTAARGSDRSGGAGRSNGSGGGDGFTAQDILDEIARAEPDVGIVTLAPELDGGIELVASLTARGHRVSLGHSAATYDEALAAIAAGARQATHLFNRMPPLHHRAPGLAGAVLQADEVAAEIICDGFHVHPALVRTAIAAKRPSGILAITDATAAAGLAPGSRTRLGGQDIVAGEEAAHLADGTIAGSILTMDRAFRILVERIGLSPVDAATVCATTPSRELGLVGHGVLKPDAVADVAVLDSEFRVVQTYIAGQLVYSRNNG